MRKIFVALLIVLSHSAAAQSWDDVNSLFQQRCVHCHSGEFSPLGLQLDNFENVMAGSENGPIINIQDIDSSPISQRVIGLSEPRMPYDGPPWLSDSEITMLRDWISSRAPGPIDIAQTRLQPEQLVDPRADGQITYNEISQIFAQRCVVCHSDNSKLGAPPEGLRLGSLEIF